MEEILMELGGLCSKYKDYGLAEEIAVSCIGNSRIRPYFDSQDFILPKDKFELLWTMAQKHNCSKIFKACIDLIFLYKRYYNQLFQEFHLFVDDVRYIIDWLDRQFGGEITKPSMEILETLAMRKILEKVPNKEVRDLFEEVQKADLIIENQDLFDLGILKKDGNKEVTFCDLNRGIAIFGSSYLLENCRYMKVVDLLIEMIADDEEYEFFNVERKGKFMAKVKYIIEFIFKDEACEKIYEKRLSENVVNLQRIFFKETGDKHWLVTRLIFSVLKYGEADVIKQILQETNEEQKTFLHRIARISENS
jgi:hypothetical protein